MPCLTEAVLLAGLFFSVSQDLASLRRLRQVIQSDNTRDGAATRQGKVLHSRVLPRCPLGEEQAAQKMVACGCRQVVA